MRFIEDEARSRGFSHTYGLRTVSLGVCRSRKICVFTEEESAYSGTSVGGLAVD